MHKVEVIHNEDKNRFEVVLADGSVALLTYRRDGDTIAYTHAETPPQHQGQGIAGQITHVAMEYAKDNDLNVQAVCPYVRHYVSEHPEYHPITQGF